VLALERGRAFSDHDRADHQVELVDQTMRQQVVPEHVAAEDLGPR